MRRLFLAVSALTLCALAACGRRGPPTDSSSVSAAIPQPSADTPAPPRRAVTEASAITGGDGGEGGAYGMPRAPIPYGELGAYERRWDQQAGEAPLSSVQPGQAGQPGQPGQAPAPSRTRMNRPRTADTVFY